MIQTARTLQWGLRDSFLRYVMTTEGARIRGDRIGDNGPFRFVEKSADDSGRTWFEGEIDISGHGGMLRLLLRDPLLREFDDGSGLVDFGYGDNADRFTMLSLVRSSDTTWSTFLTDDGARVFAGSYAAGQEMCPIVVTSS